MDALKCKVLCIESGDFEAKKRTSVLTEWILLFDEVTRMRLRDTLKESSTEAIILIMCNVVPEMCERGLVQEDNSGQIKLGNDRPAEVSMSSKIVSHQINTWASRLLRRLGWYMSSFLFGR